MQGAVALQGAVNRPHDLPESDRNDSPNYNLAAPNELSVRELYMPGQFVALLNRQTCISISLQSAAAEGISICLKCV